MLEPAVRELGLTVGFAADKYEIRATFPFDKLFNFRNHSNYLFNFVCLTLSFLVSLKFKDIKRNKSKYKEN